MADVSDPNDEQNPYAPPRAPQEPQGERRRPERTPDRGLRLWARFIDTLLFLMAFAPVFLVVSAIGRLDTLPTRPQAILVIALALLPLALLAYQWSLLWTQGQTLAKRWVGLRVIRRDGERAGFARGVLLREWPRFAAYWIGLGALRPEAGTIPTLALIAWVVDALMIFAADRRCLHDHLAGTRVIQVSPSKGRSRRRRGGQ